MQMNGQDIKLMFRFDSESETEYNQNILCMDRSEANLSTTHGTAELGGPTMIEGVNVVRNTSFVSVIRPSENG